MKYMVVAGEASGDLHASEVMTHLRELDPGAEFRFLGGDLMAKAARRNPEIHYEKMNVMGFSAVVRHLPTILTNLRVARRLVREWRPDVLLLVDYPSFNLRLAKYACRLGIRVDWLISPKVWAWKEWRVRTLRRVVTHMYCILPFEIPFYRRHGYDEATYVGNPSVGEIDRALGHLPPLRHFLERQGITDSRPIIALLPGSRRGEIAANLPLMLEAARRFTDYQVIVAAAPAVPERFYREIAQDPGLALAFGSTIALLKYARAAVVTSGTATLETALVGTPQVVCYRANGRRWTYNIMKRLLNVRYVSLPNLIMDNSIVPELLLHKCTAEGIAHELAPLLQPSPQREWQTGGYKAMRRRLGTGDAAAVTAELIVRSMTRQ